MFAHVNTDTHTHTHTNTHTQRRKHLTMSYRLFLLVLGSVFSFSQAMAGGGLGQSLKRLCWCCWCCLLAAQSLQQAQLWAGLATKPVRGFPIEWWRIRVWEGKFYYIYRSGYYEELQQWEVESLEEAFTTEPEMAVFIMGQSQMHSRAVGEWPPYWNVESSSRGPPPLTCGCCGQAQSLKEATGRTGLT